MNLERLFLGEATLAEHHSAQSEHRASYIATLLLVLAHGVDLSTAIRARVLAAAWARKDRSLARELLEQPGFGLPEVVRALELLDAGRKIRALERKLARLEAGGTATASTLGGLRSQIQALSREGLVGSVSGALAREVRRWIRTVPASAMEFWALTFPLEGWRTLADLVHPTREDFALPWFLPVAFGEPAPDGTTVAVCQQATDEQLAVLAAERRVPWSYLRLRLKSPSDELRARVAGYESLDTLLWYYEELRGPATDAAIEARLRQGEASSLGYGKLLERLLAARALGAPWVEPMVSVLDARLQEMALPLDPPVVVLGDASDSMSVAIRVATIVGSLLAALSRAHLRFFNQGCIEPPVVPRSVGQVLQVTDAIRASGSTAPVAALWPSIQKRELVRTFVVVTDEEENTPHQGMRFETAFARYRQEIYPAALVFLSFIQPGAPGQMVAALQLQGIACRQFRFDRARPDLTKLDDILGRIGVAGSLFSERVSLLAQSLREGSLAQALAAARQLLAEGR